MGSLNKTLLIGRVGFDPEVCRLPDGTTNCVLQVETVERLKSSEPGEFYNHYEWHRVSLLGRLAEVAGRYVRSDEEIYIEGNIRSVSWVDEYGQRRSYTEIVATEMKMLGSKPKNSGYAPAKKKTAELQKTSNAYDDIPF